MPLLLVFIFISFFGVAQPLDQIQLQKSDSLKRLLASTKEDTSRILILNEYSRVLQTVGRKKEGLIQAGKAKALAVKLNYPKGVAASNASLGNAYRELKQYDEALNVLLLSLKECQNIKYKKEEGFIYHNLGQIYWIKKDTARAINCHQKALEINKQIPILNRQGFAHDQLGFLYVQKHNYELALKHFKESFSVFKELNITHRIALSAGNAGMTNMWLGNVNEALKYYIIAVENYSLEDNTEGILWMYSLISDVYRSIHDYDNAMKYNLSLLELYQQVDSVRGVGEAYDLIGVTNMEIGDYQKALMYFDKARGIFQGNNYAVGILNTSIHYAQLLIEQKKYELAVAKLNEAQNLARKEGKLKELAEIYKWKGYSYSELKDYDLAYTYLKDALSFFQKVGDKKELTFLYERLAQVAECKYDYKEAYQFYRLFVKYKSDELFLLDDTEKLALKFEFDRRESQAKEALLEEIAKKRLVIVALIFSIALTSLVIVYFQLRKKNYSIQQENIVLQQREYERVKELEAFKSRFLTNISHEFRTPLTLIRGHLDVLMERGREEDQSRFKEMYSNGELLMGLIDQLLNLSKMENGEYRLFFEDRILTKELDAIVAAFFSFAKQKEIDLHYEYTREAETFFNNSPFGYSSEALNSIVNNLIINALKYTPKGGRITVVVDVFEGDLKFSVSDTGEGIPDDSKLKVFDRFYKVDHLEKENISGSGVGLALVKELAILHGGEVYVQDSNEGGSCFVVIIKNTTSPQAEVQTMKINQAIVDPLFVGVQETEMDGNIEYPLILVVEDHPSLNSFIRDNLGEEYRFIHAENGREGLNLALEHSPDLIISDVMMPEMNGIELCSRLKADLLTSHIPVIMVSAKATENDLLNGLSFGADDYVTKPFSLMELRLRVRNRLRLQNVWKDRFKQGKALEKRSIQEWSERDQIWMNKLTDFIVENISNTDLSVGDLAEISCLSTSQLNRKLKALIDKSALDLVRQVRMEKAHELLESKLSVSSVAWEVGFEDPIYFSKVFKKYHGFSPSSVKNQRL